MPREKADDDLCERIWALPLDERCALLTLSVIERNPLMLQTAFAVLDLLMKVASGLGGENRRKLAQQMHRAADVLDENPARPVSDADHALH